MLILPKHNTPSEFYLSFNCIVITFVVSFSTIEYSSVDIFAPISLTMLSRISKKPELLSDLVH